MSANFVNVGPIVGSHAPEILVSGLASRAIHGEPRVLAFAHAWSLESERPEAIGAIRAQLRGLGAELVVLSQRGVWSVHADDPVEHLGAPSERLAAEVAMAARLYGVGADGDAVFVIDGRGVVRFAHRPDARQRPVCPTLAGALAIATNALHARPTQRTQDRVLFTRREWTVTCLVLGCAAAFLSGCKDQP